MKDQTACVEAAATMPSPLESRGEHGLGDSGKDHHCQPTFEESGGGWGDRPGGWCDADLHGGPWSCIMGHFRSKEAATDHEKCCFQSLLMFDPN